MEKELIKEKHVRNTYNKYALKKKPIPKFKQRKNDVYVTNKSSLKQQHKRCEDLFNSGIQEIYVHCVGNAIKQGLNLALNLINNSNGGLSYAVYTSTIRYIDELHPLYDDEDITIQKRNNSAIHIKIFRNTINLLTSPSTAN
uniref:Ribonuclease P protein subunit p20 n=1 Tax=Glossina brevipalpis TaxID=37001 RepID=A0A1A9WJT2_9MUSC